MDSNQNNIFPDGTFPHKKQSLLPKEVQEKTAEKLQKSMHSFSASIHIPYKACRLSRKVHISDDSIVQPANVFYIPALEEEIAEAKQEVLQQSISEISPFSKTREIQASVKQKNIYIPQYSQKENKKKYESTAICKTQKCLPKASQQKLLSIRVIEKPLIPASKTSVESIPILQRPKNQTLSKASEQISVSSVSGKKQNIQSASPLLVSTVKMPSNILAISTVPIPISAVTKKQKSKNVMSAISVPQISKKIEARNIPFQISKQSLTEVITVQYLTKKNIQIHSDPQKVEQIIRITREGFAKVSHQVPTQKRKEVASSSRTPKEKRKRSHLFLKSFFQKKPAQKKEKLQAKKKSGLIKEVVKFGMTTAVIFTVSFSVMNASALTELFSAKLNPVAAIEKQLALEEIVSQKNYAPILPTAGMKHQNRASFPSLSLKIGPLENRIIIPKIGKNVPVVGVKGNSLEKGDWNQLEDDIQDALKAGVVHYPGTAQPGQVGNVFVTGHSSYYLWDPGKYKDVFVRLHDLEIGDEFTIFWNQDVFHYRIRERKVVSPEETSVLRQPRHERIATLMTCTPIGTAKDRLVLIADQI